MYIIQTEHSFLFKIQINEMDKQTMRVKQRSKLTISGGKKLKGNGKEKRNANAQHRMHMPSISISINYCVARIQNPRERGKKKKKERIRKEREEYTINQTNPNRLFSESNVS